MPNACQISSLNPPPITLSQLPFTHSPYPFPVPTCTLYPDPYPSFMFHIPYFRIPYFHIPGLQVYKFTSLQVYKFTSIHVSILFESFDTLPRAWGPLPCRAVPCEPLPRVPGAPPGGGSRHQSTRVKVWRAHLFFASNFSSFLISVFIRFGVDLGSLLGVLFAPFGALVGLSWSQNRLRSVLSSKK